MATILNQEEQKQALKNINSSIKDVEAANIFMQASNPSGKYLITFTGEDGKKYTTEIHVSNKDDINMMVQTYKEEEKKRIVSLAEANRIALDSKDEEILNFSFIN